MTDSERWAITRLQEDQPDMSEDEVAYHIQKKTLVGAHYLLAYEFETLFASMRRDFGWMWRPLWMLVRFLNKLGVK